MWLKWYSVLMAVFVFIAFFITGFHNFMDYLNAAETILEMFGLFGYAFRVCSFNERFWKISFPLFVLFDVVGCFYQSAGWSSIAANFAFQTIVGFPMYVALYRYAFSSRNLWQS